MQSRTRFPRPYPREVVRDLLGIARALYRAERAKTTPDPSRLARIEEVGKNYRLSLELGIKFEPDTMAGRAALTWAERATEGLGAIVVAASELMAPAVAATAERIRRRG